MDLSFLIGRQSGGNGRDKAGAEEAVPLTADEQRTLENAKEVLRQVHLADYESVLATLQAVAGDVQPHRNLTFRLDESQTKGMAAALTKQVALIQGPPGTGKSYIGVKIVRAILNNATRAANLLPILVITYTNHALDQFLEDLMEDDVPASKMVRLGSRSKSERLAECSMEKRVQHLKDNKQEHSQAAWYVRKGLMNNLTEAGDDLKRCLASKTEESDRHSSLQPCDRALCKWLEELEPGFVKSLRTGYDYRDMDNHDGFTVVGRHLSVARALETWLAGEHFPGRARPPPRQAVAHALMEDVYKDDAVCKQQNHPYSYPHTSCAHPR
jgi:hypothetical protein